MTERDREALAEALKAWRVVCCLKFPGDDHKWLNMYFRQLASHNYILSELDRAN